MKLKFTTLIKRFIWLDWLILSLLFVLLLYLIVVVATRSLKKTPSVEYLAKTGVASREKSGRDIWVDVSGAVATPGVYKMAEEARIKDALIAAGGLTDEADRDFVASAINLAQKVNDGDKIFIPTAGGEVAGAVTARVNLNKATSAKLEGLSGIGSARAEAIIKNRPYASVDDLVTKKIISAGILNKIRDQITVY